jgi:hypothetical protein
MIADEIDAKWGHFFAQDVLLQLLVSKVKESDPTFEDFARRSFDAHLGKHFEEVGKAHAMEVEARKVFNVIISTPIGTTPQAAPIKVKKPTWRRRFLNWLEEG